VLRRAQATGRAVVEYQRIVTLAVDAVQHSADGKPPVREPGQVRGL
jgi:hypothetical protein